jgi:tyrosyl-tRNA synthetase
MKFTIANSVFEKFPDFKVGVLVVSGIKNPEDRTTLRLLIDEASKKALDVSPTHPKVASWLNAFEKLGLNPLETKPAHIALLDRVRGGGQVPSIEPIVDIANSVSLKHTVPIGTHTLNELIDDVEIRPTTEHDVFTPMRSTASERVESSILAYTSGNQVLTKNLVWRQGETSKIRPTSTDVFVPIDTFDSVSENELLVIMDELGQLIQKYLQPESIIKTIVSRTSPSFSWENAENNSAINSKSSEVLSRGVVEVLPSKNSLLDLMSKKKIRVFMGIDPTGSFLTLGHSVGLRKLQQFADLGHEAIMLIGNGTVKIGDPTGRDTTRPELTDEQIEENFQEWKKQASKILDFDKIKIVYNGDWLGKLNYSDLIKLMAKVTVQQLLERDMFQERLKNGHPIFGHEIMYPMMQGYDSVAMDVDLEIGGTDQTFNMMMGRTLQKAYNNHEKWVLTTPIINGTDGRKMSKSYGNFVALTDEPKDMYGKLMRITDDMIIEYFTVLTDVPMSEIDKMQQAMTAGENPMTFKKKLAFTITEMYHSTTDATQAEEYFHQAVQQNMVPADAPSVALEKSSLAIGEFLQKALTGESNSNIRRLLEQRSIELLPSGQRPTDFNEVVNFTQVKAVRVGKHRYFTIEL